MKLQFLSGWSWFQFFIMVTPYQSEDPTPTIQPIERKKKMGKQYNKKREQAVLFRKFHPITEFIESWDSTSQVRMKLTRSFWKSYPIKCWVIPSVMELFGTIMEFPCLEWRNKPLELMCEIWGFAYHHIFNKIIKIWVKTCIVCGEFNLNHYWGHWQCLIQPYCMTYFITCLQSIFLAEQMFLLTKK